MYPHPAHPTWCEYPLAPNDTTHTHTALIGTTYLARDTTIEVVLVQRPDACRPMLTMHITAPTARHSIDITGTQAWGLAGTLIDATVAHAHAGPTRPPAPVTPGPASTQPPPTTTRSRPMWLLDRHPNGRMPRLRSSRMLGRCGRTP